MDAINAAIEFLKVDHERFENEQRGGLARQRVDGEMMDRGQVAEALGKIRGIEAMRSRSDAWYAVCGALNFVFPEWSEGEGTGMENAVAAIEKLASNQRPAEQDVPQAQPQPFDLEAAKRGEALVTRDGRTAVFIAHDSGAYDRFQVYARPGSTGCASSYYENGRRDADHDSGEDLFMAPKPKRTGG